MGAAIGGLTVRVCSVGSSCSFRFHLSRSACGRPLLRICCSPEGGHRGLEGPLLLSAALSLTTLSSPTYRWTYRLRLTENPCVGGRAGGLTGKFTSHSPEATASTTLTSTGQLTVHAVLRDALRGWASHASPSRGGWHPVQAETRRLPRYRSLAPSLPCFTTALAAYLLFEFEERLPDRHGPAQVGLGCHRQPHRL